MCKPLTLPPRELISRMVRTKSWVALARGIEPRRAFALWAWAMLFVVLLSAVPTGGQARTRLVGSAFDPTTVSVALRTRPTTTTWCVVKAA